jgi:hypothetical protein
MQYLSEGMHSQKLFYFRVPSFLEKISPIIRFFGEDQSLNG